MDQKQQISAGLLCPYCLTPTICMESGSAGAPRLLPGRRAMVCPGCGSYVYCHPGTSTPMGSVADDNLRRLRWAAHKVFDMVWRLKLKRSRYNAYSWLSLRLKLSKDVTHMGLFDQDTCLRAIRLCSDYILSKLPATELPDSVKEILEEFPAEKKPGK